MRCVLLVAVWVLGVFASGCAWAEMPDFGPNVLVIFLEMAEFRVVIGSTSIVDFICIQPLKEPKGSI